MKATARWPRVARENAITALDVALQGDRNPAGVLFMSGAPLVVDQWAQRLPSHRGMRVLMTHGASDPVLPAVASGWARDLLVQGGAAVVSKNHGGGHDLGGPDVLQAIAEFVRSSIPGMACAPGTSCGPGG